MSEQFRINGAFGNRATVHRDERFIGARTLFRTELDAFELARAYDRLAVLNERRNDFARAAEFNPEQLMEQFGADNQHGNDEHAGDGIGHRII